MDKRAFASAVFILLVLTLLLWGIPKYKVYSRELNGKAQLKEAEWSRKIAIEEAVAEKESAKLKAEAEVIRARGIAEANEIIADSITESYIRYKFVEGLNDGNTEVIYVPTEANLPILEATRGLN
ncbi:MAG: membrane protease subunit [Candidatus Woesearchaeota archaeon]|jgi:regulator of protease activity HflC (stomatin/prohibitin superfamily)|nr:membrane protease subunit [Candidatus Woesearchaeota archaeon]MDP7198096.1 membrane protease subunit [Candidatus Woesearchaeota archaeon]MDP7466930.1 membrane protease subunit [Candidatus Woesearchaeota archaeon]MDP7647365.1 membrane protease subunit [Candidatus Woesearchaeota archaeon]|tara:strand:- start:455 stop:829 length:375 start_codon:yes stop_codon:yes gene_type:complete